MGNIPTIRLENVSKLYGDSFAVKNINFSIAQGECLALVGHNGAGKTTLIKLVLGLLQPSSGELSIMGGSPQDTNFDKLREDIGFLPEQVLFQTNMTGREMLKFYSRLKNAKLNQIDGLFERVDLLAAADNKISTYSKGMRQRLGLAQALIGHPKVLILDEPTSGLDPLSRQTVYSIIDEEKKAGATVFVSSHALTELDNRIDRVAILNKGELVAIDSIENLRRDIGLKSIIRVSAKLQEIETISQNFMSNILKLEANKNQILLACPLDEKPILLKALFQLNLDLSNIEIIDPSLEQVFMKYTLDTENTNEEIAANG
ncbi:MAG: ABC transporter ATP-binding protein [Rhizobiales bacterium]|nr:ABC transporter ATP-binding protein [Hyphomicrobiales bacterium]